MERCDPQVFEALCDLLQEQQTASEREAKRSQLSSDLKQRLGR